MNKYVEVAPCLRLPKFLGTFDYKIKTEQINKIKVGQLVKISFRKKNVIGLVVKIKNDSLTPETNLKEILEILDLPRLPNSFLKLIFWLANYYYISPALALKTMLPKITKLRTTKKTPALKLPNVVLPNLNETNELKKLSTNLNQKKVLLVTDNQSKKEAIYSQLISKVIKQKKQVILLFPEIGLGNTIIDYYYALLGQDNVAVFNSQLTSRQLFINWKKVLNGQAKLIIGTRQAIFAPAKSLGLIIIDSEQDPSYKQWDQNPRYNVIDVAEELHHLNQCRILVSSISPSVEKYQQSLDGEYKLLSLAEAKRNSKILIADMRDEIKKKNFSVISEVLFDKLNLLLKQKKQAILFLNRRGNFSYVACRDCGYIPKCPHCQTAFSYFQSANTSQGNLICYNCQEKGNLSLHCPNCQGHRYKYIGAGVANIALELNKLFSHAKVALFDSEQKKDLTIIEKYITKEIDILVATQAIFNTPNPIKADLVAMVNIDIGLNLPDFRAGEKTWQTANKLLSFQPDYFIIQTYNSESYIIDYLQNPNWQEFYRHELKIRKGLNYPPFGQLVKIIFQDVDNRHCQKAAANLFYEYQKILRIINADVKILGPMPAFTPRVRGRWRWQIILKLPLSLNLDIRDQLLKIVSENCLIDINPESLL